MKSMVIKQYRMPFNSKISMPRFLKTYKFNFSAEFCFLLLYSIYSFFYVFDESLIPITPIMKLIKAMSVAMLLFIFFLRNGFEVKRIFLSALLSVILTISAINADKTFLMIYGFFLIAAHVTDIKKIVRCSLISTFTATICVMLLSQIGVILDRVYVRDSGIAHCMGFSYYSTYPYILLFNMLSYMYLKRDKVTFLQLALFVVGNYFVYRLSSLRLTFCLVMLAIVLYIVLVKLEKLNLNRFLIKFAGCLLFPITFGVTLYASLNYSSTSTFWIKFNELLSNRLALQHEGLRRYGITLFGQYVKVRALTESGRISAYYFYIDSGYIFSLLGYGLICTLIILAIYSYLTYHACKENDRVLFVWMITIALFSIVNNTWVNLTFNGILFMITCKIVKDHLGWRFLNGFKHTKT